MTTCATTARKFRSILSCQILPSRRAWSLIRFGSCHAEKETAASKWVNGVAWSFVSVSIGGRSRETFPPRQRFLSLLRQPFAQTKAEQFVKESSAFAFL